MLKQITKILYENIAKIILIQNLSLKKNLIVFHKTLVFELMAAYEQDGSGSELDVRVGSCEGGIFRVKPEKIFVVLAPLLLVDQGQLDLHM